ncbi:MAG: 2-oxoacid:acceptor oxidoreductase subunit alpha [Candidatus Roizmanbacteria bacterium]
MKRFNWKIGGEAGFGIMTTGMMYAKVVTRSGYHMFDYSEYPSLVRGGHNTCQVVISEEPVSSVENKIDVLVCLNKQSYEHDKDKLHKDSIVIYDAEEFDFSESYIKVPVPFKNLKDEFKIMMVMVNMIALGATMAITGADLNILHTIIEEEFTRKGEAIVDFNKKLVLAGFDHVSKTVPQLISPVLKKKNEKSKVIINANDAFSLASVAGDCRLFCAYPMTPSSSVLTSLASWQEKTGMIVRHAEDEISVIHTALGASFAGVRSAVATSGGGFALMVEAISFAGIAELPIVVWMGQRPGPATGMPTWTEQGDLLFCVHAGHGEFQKIVLAPGDAEEALELGMEAFNLAELYQLPVIVLGDKLICESHKSYDQDEIVSMFANFHKDDGKLTRVTNQEKYLRYKLSEDGISERLVPGAKGQFYQANSYEHFEDGHTSEDEATRLQQVEKRDRKIQTYISTHYKCPRIYGDLESAEAIIVSWGGNKGAILDAINMMKEEGKKIAYIHFTHLFPMNETMVKPLFKENKRYVLVENNSHAQFGKLLRMETGIEISEKLLKWNGRPFRPEEIVAYFSK